MGHLCSKVTVATPRYKKKTWECATADLSSQLHRGKFSPLYDLKGGNGFPFRTRDNKDFIKVVLKSVSNSATLVIFNLRKLNQEFEKQKYIMLPEKIIETKFAYHIYYPYVEQDLISFVGLHEITPNGRDAILTQIKAAIQFLHRNEYVHRDIKPENILVKNNELDIWQTIIFISSFFVTAIIISASWAPAFSRTDGSVALPTIPFTS